MKKLSKEFKHFLSGVKQVEHEKQAYEKVARIERSQRKSTLNSEDASMILVLIIVLLFMFGMFALLIFG